MEGIYMVSVSYKATMRQITVPGALPDNSFVYHFLELLSSVPDHL